MGEGAGENQFSTLPTILYSEGFARQSPGILLTRLASGDNRGMNKTAWILIGILILGHLLVDFFLPSLMFPRAGGQWLFAALLGVCVAQVNLIAVWAALAPGRVLLRLPWSIFLGVLMWYALVLGNRVRPAWTEYWGGISLDEALQLGLIILAGVIVVQIPLWIASRLSRWRLLPPGKSGDDAIDERQFNIRHLIAGTLVTSLALGAGRLVLPPGELRIARLDDELWVLLPVVTVVNLIVAMPCIWGAFVRARWLLPLALGWVFYAVVATLVEVAFLIAVLGGPGSDDVWGYMTLFNICQCGCVFGTLLCLRAVGFRLVRLPNPTGITFIDPPPDEEASPWPAATP